MARSLRDLRRKMKAIHNTRQVTRAMELVAASKMRRAVESAQKLKRYAWTAYRILERIASHHSGLHPYLAEREVHNVLALLFTSDRGLCGSLNAQLFREMLKYADGLKTIPTFERIQWVAIGKKGQRFLARTGQNVIAAFPALSNRPTFNDVLSIARLATDSYLQGMADHVVLIYTDFRSALKQTPAFKVLLPFSHDELKDMLASLTQRVGEASPRVSRGEASAGRGFSSGSGVCGMEPSFAPSELRTGREVKPREGKEASPRPPRGEASEAGPQEYLFEPSPREIAETIIPQLTESQIFQAVLETAASEHSARMVAMKNATDNASDLLDDLRLTYNQSRQAGITAELAELSASKVALE